MAILQNLPFSLCESGPEQIDGIGNSYLQVMAPASPHLPVSTLYLLDSHGQIPSKISNPDYEHIKQNQIDWFVSTSQAQRSARQAGDNDSRFHLSLVFQHIPLPEFGDPHLRIHSGHRREPPESPSFNSHFYDALVKEGISASKPLILVLGYAMEVVADSGGIVRTAESDTTDECEYGNLIPVSGT